MPESSRPGVEKSDTLVDHLSEGAIGAPATSFVYDLNPLPFGQQPANPLAVACVLRSALRACMMSFADAR